MPHLVEDVDYGTYGPSWEEWPTPELPDLPIEPWADFPDVFWKLSIATAPVDGIRTAQLPAVNVPFGDSSAGGNPYMGAVGGFPYNLIDHSTPTTKTWNTHYNRTLQLFPWPPHWDYTNCFVQVPFPDLVRREGDPAGVYDQHVYLYNWEDEELWELIQVENGTPAQAVSWGTCDWKMQYSGGGNYDHWDMKIPWDAPSQPGGAVAAGFPHLPLWARYDEIVAGHINHALFLALPNYATGFCEPARSGDGDIPDHPLRVGARLRLKTAVRNTFTPGSPERVFANALTEYGCIVGDRTMHNVGDYYGETGGFAITMDPRWGDFTFHTFQLTDFEVVPPVALWPEYETDPTPDPDPDPPPDPDPDPPPDPPPTVVTPPGAIVITPGQVDFTVTIDTLPPVEFTIHLDLSTHPIPPAG